MVVTTFNNTSTQNSKINPETRGTCICQLTFLMRHYGTQKKIVVNSFLINLINMQQLLIHMHALITN
jgi:hypothetical protein